VLGVSTAAERRFKNQGYLVESIHDSRNFKDVEKEIKEAGDDWLLRQPINNTGLFTLWWALKEDFNPIYVVGLDFVRWAFPSGFNIHAAREALSNFEQGIELPPDVRIAPRTSYWNNHATQAKWTIAKFPEKEVYRVPSVLSCFPALEKNPFKH